MAASATPPSPPVVAAASSGAGHVPVDLVVSHIANLPLNILHDRVLLVTVHIFHDYMASSAAGSNSAPTAVMTAPHMSCVCRYSVRISSNVVYDSSGQTPAVSSGEVTTSSRPDVVTLLDDCKATFPISLARNKCVFRLTLAHYYISRRTGAEKAEPLAIVDFGFNLKTLLHEKIRPFLIGTVCGQVGLAFSIGEGDVDGYARRLAAFADEHCPAMKPKINQIVQTATELQCFSKLYSKFAIMDFSERLEYFFYLYRIGDVQAAHEALAAWAGNELLLLSKLVMEHGPEPRDIPRALRARAFADVHGLQAATIAIDGTWEVFSMLMAELVHRYGPEPHPRTYLFPPVATSLPLSPDAAVPDTSRSRLRELHRAQFPTDPDDPDNYRHLRFEERTSVYIAQQRAKSSPWPLNKEQELIERAQKKTSSFAFDAVEALEAKPAVRIPTYAEQLAREAEREKFEQNIASKHYTVEDAPTAVRSASVPLEPQFDPIALRKFLGRENANRAGIVGAEESERQNLVEWHIYGCRAERNRMRLRATEGEQRQEIAEMEARGRGSLQQLVAAELEAAVRVAKLRADEERSANMKAILSVAARESSNRLGSTATAPPPPVPPVCADPLTSIDEWNRRVVVPPERSSSVAPLPPLTASIVQLPTTVDDDVAGGKNYSRTFFSSKSLPLSATGAASSSSAVLSSGILAAGKIQDSEIGSKVHWIALCNALNVHHIPFEAVLYLNDIRFANLCFEIGIPAEDAELFARERHRKIYGGTTINFVSTDSATGKSQIEKFLRHMSIAPILFHFSSVGIVSNKTHAEVFQHRLDDAIALSSKSASDIVHRRYLVQTHSEAMQTCFFGLQCSGPIRFYTSFFDMYSRASYKSDEDIVPAATIGNALLAPSTDIAKTIQLMEIGAQGNPATANVQQGSMSGDDMSSGLLGLRASNGGGQAAELTILLCDVIAGNILELSGDAPAQLPVEYDAAICRQHSEGEALVVYNPRSVLPVAWISCDVDLHAKPCVNHPTVRAVPLPKTAHSDLDDAKTLLCAECLAARVAKEMYDPQLRLLEPPSQQFHKLDIIGYPRIPQATNTHPSPQQLSPPDNRSSYSNYQRSPSPTPVPSAGVRPSFRSEAPDVASMMRTAWTLYRQGNTNAAAAQWRAIFQMYPETSEGREALGIIAEVCDGRFDEAVSLYQSALDVNPYSCSALYRCANLLETRYLEYAAAQELFARCAALGDETGARRAMQLRARLASGGSGGDTSSNFSYSSRGPRAQEKPIPLREDLVVPAKKYYSSFQAPGGASARRNVSYANY